MILGRISDDEMEQTFGDENDLQRTQKILAPGVWTRSSLSLAVDNCRTGRRILNQKILKWVRSMLSMLRFGGWFILFG
jgi:hypothetical protein